jgi:hypothetical protein
MRRWLRAYVTAAMCVDVFGTTSVAGERSRQRALEHAQLTTAFGAANHGARERSARMAGVSSVRYCALSGIYIPSLE